MTRLLILAACATFFVPSRVTRAVEAEPAAVFSGAQGNYGGIIQAAGGNFLNAGALKIVVTPTGSFTANLNWQGYPYPFVGKFNAGTATFDRKFQNRGQANSALLLHLVLDPAPNLTIQSTLDIREYGSTVLTATGELSGARPDATAGQAYQGTTNTSFIDPPNYGDVPQDIKGDGFSIAKVSKAKNRSLRLAGRLPDTTGFSVGSPLRGTVYTFFTALYRNKHGVGGNAYGSVDASDPTALFSTVLWAKRPNTDPKYYPAGFNTGVGIITSGYSKSVSARTFPHISTSPGPVNATLTLTAGNLPTNITAQIRIGLFNVKVFAPNPQRITLATGPAGLNWAGTFIHPNTGRRTAFHGGFTEARNGVNGEGRGNFRGSVATTSADQLESGSARITVNP